MKTDPSNPLLAGAPASAQAPNPSTYGQTSYDTQARYVITDPALPNNDGGVVKTGTGNLTDPAFLNVTQTENEAMTGNVNYPTPSPSVVTMEAAISDFNQKLNAATQARLTLKEATNLKDAARVTLESLYKSRALYVQGASNGNTALILNAGFAVRNSNSPIGELPPPQNLNVDLNGTIGKMIVHWNSVKKCRSYILECAVVNDEPPVWHLIEVGGKPTLTLWNQVVGVTYIFRVAAVGGTGGRSAWSTTTTRTAA